MHPSFPSLGASFLSHTEVHPSMCALNFIPSHWNSVPSYVSAYSGHTSASSTLRNYSRKAQDLLQSYTQETFFRHDFISPLHGMAWHGMGTTDHSSPLAAFPAPSLVAPGGHLFFHPLLKHWLPQGLILNRLPTYTLSLGDFPHLPHFA